MALMVRLDLVETFRRLQAYAKSRSTNKWLDQFSSSCMLNPQISLLACQIVDSWLRHGH